MTASNEGEGETRATAIRLPRGVRDYLPRAARRRRVLAEALVAEFERWGYRRIITPAFEYEEVLARGLGPDARTAAIRFVEPLTGEVAVLRPDITPQVARLVASRLTDVAGPVRLCYEGSVLRLSSGPRGQREIIQAGVELFGVRQPAGDVEVATLAAAALEAIGLGRGTLDLGHPAFVRAAVRALALPRREREELLAAIAKKDRAAVRAHVRRAPASAPARRLVEELPALYGGPEVLREARRLCAARPLRAALREVEAVAGGLAARGLGARLAVDLGEVRGFDYYTGLRIAAYVDGLGDAVLAGGRYDRLCERYGRACPATGFAVDVEAAAAAQKARGMPPPAPEPGVLVCGPPSLAAEVCTALRRAGLRAAAHPATPPAEARAFAERWDFTNVIALERLSAAELASLRQGRLPEDKRG